MHVFFLIVESCESIVIQADLLKDQCLEFFGTEW